MNAPKSARSASLYTEVGERIAAAYDSGHRQGHRCGYMDAVGEFWEFMKDIPTGDPRFKPFLELSDFLRLRRDAALSHADAMYDHEARS